MSTKLTRAHFEQRIDAFYTFAREQGSLVAALGPGRSGRHHDLVQNGEHVVEVSLTSMETMPHIMNALIRFVMGR